MVYCILCGRHHLILNIEAFVSLVELPDNFNYSL